MTRHIVRLISVTALLALGGCANLAPPRPLAEGEVYWCCPGSAVPRRVSLAQGMELPGAKIGAFSRARCGTF